MNGDEESKYIWQTSKIKLETSKTMLQSIFVLERGVLERGEAAKDFRAWEKRGEERQISPKMARGGEYTLTHDPI